MGRTEERGFGSGICWKEGLAFQVGGRSVLKHLCGLFCCNVRECLERVFEAFSAGSGSLEGGNCIVRPGFVRTNRSSMHTLDQVQRACWGG